MFGVRTLVFAGALLGMAVSVPLDAAEARSHPSKKESYSHNLRQSYAKQHTRRSYAKLQARKSYAHHRPRKSYAALHARKSYARHHAPNAYAKSQARKSYAYGNAGRPARWCGWWMRSQLGGGPELNLARNWASWGRPSSPQVGAVVVWSHHVGLITGRAANGQWIVKSGNDGGRVRERPRSVAGAVFRVSA